MESEILKLITGLGLNPLAALLGFIIWWLLKRNKEIECALLEMYKSLIDQTEKNTTAMTQLAGKIDQLR